MSLHPQEPPSVPEETIRVARAAFCRMLVESQQRHGVVVVGPVVEDTSWQAHAAEGFSKASFHVDWDQQVVTCPEGKQSISWLPSTYPYGILGFDLSLKLIATAKPAAMVSNCPQPALIVLGPGGL